MFSGLLKYIGEAGTRILTKEDLGKLGASAEQLVHLAEDDVLTFVKGEITKVEPTIAEFIASHSALSAEFHALSDEEAADEKPATPTAAEPVAPTAGAPTGEVSPNAGSQA